MPSITNADTTATTQPITISNTGKFSTSPPGDSVHSSQIPIDEYKIQTFELRHDKTNIMRLRPARMRRLVWMNAGRKRTMLVLSWRGSLMTVRIHVLIFLFDTLSRIYGDFPALLVEKHLSLSSAYSYIISGNNRAPE
jgi:hypothetical protein